METRKIVIVETRNQRKSTIMSAATTLAELKRDLDANNINYTNMTFFEGTSKTELKVDSAILPHNVPYKGIITNDLVFMLTNSNKKIRSGGSTMSRADIYNVIKSKSLQEACTKKFGKNYTMCKTTDLIQLIEDNNDTSKKPIKEVTTKVSNSTPTNNKCVDLIARDAINTLINMLEENGTLEYTEREQLSQIFKGSISTYSTNGDKESPYSSSEIDDMFSEMNIN